MSNEAGERIKWRAHFNQLISRPIPESELFSGRYRVSAKVVREMWGLSEHQFKRFKRWVYMTDAFMEFQEGEPDEDDRV